MTLKQQTSGNGNIMESFMNVRNFGFRKLIMASLSSVALLACSQLKAETLLESDFTTPMTKSALQLKESEIANGILTVGNGSKCKAAATFAIKGSASFSVFYSMRIAEVAQSFREGVLLIGADGRKCEILRRAPYGGDGDTTIFAAQGSRVIAKQNFPQQYAFPRGEGIAMTQCELRFSKGFVEMKVNGRSMGSVALEFFPVEKLCFYANDAKVQIDDLKVTTIDEEKRLGDCEKPVFKADFDNGVAAVDENGAKIEPTSETPPTTKPGVKGSALDASKEAKFKSLTYNVGEILGSEGAIMFWTNPGTSARESVNLLDANGKIRLTCCAMNYGFAAKLVRPDDTKYDFVLRGSKYAMYPGTWNHYAVTWDATGAVRIFRNGLPYIPNYDAGEQNVGCSSGFDLSDIRKIQILEGADALIDNLSVFRRKVSPAEVYAEFRKDSPLDVMIDDAMVQPKENAAFDVEFAPGGTYTRPAHKGPLCGDVKGELTLELYERESRKLIKTMSTPLQVKESPVSVKFPTGKLAIGEYFVVWNLKFPDGRTMRRGIYTECRELPSNALVASNEDVKPGKLIFEKKFTDPNDPVLLKEGPLSARKDGGIEIGANKGDRVATVIQGLKDFIQKPVLVEIEWPDDAVRMMGLYIYWESKGAAFRDRLQGGIQAGKEYPNTGKHVLTRYIVWPQTPTCLFEARTMAKNFTGAINAVRIYEIEGGVLPKLAIDTPKKMDFRKVGVFDEDQTLRVILASKNALDMMQRLCDYMDYTGQTTYHTSLVRYYFSNFPFPENRATLQENAPGALAYIIDALGARGKEVYYAKALEVKQPALIALDKSRNEIPTYDGRVGTPNVANPVARKMAARYLLDFKNEMSKPNFTGISVWATTGWGSIEAGYDSYTVNKFSEDTGIKIPATGQFEFLTSEQVLPRWSEWRAKQVFEMVKELRAVMDSIKPSLKLYVMHRGDFDWFTDLEKMVPKLPNTYSCDVRHPTYYRSTFHWGSPETQSDEKSYDFKGTQEIFKNRSSSMVSLFYTYYETFTKSLSKDYGCYFQNADVKPWGRNFLKELAFNVAASDIHEIAMGGQPFGSWGREAETREFAKAFSALPARDFTSVNNPNNSIVTRYLNTENGTYFYLVSLVQSDSQAKLKFGGKTPEYVDLSTGAKSSASSITLKPFELRSFLVPKEKVKISSVAYTFPKELRDLYVQHMAKLDEAQKMLGDKGVDTSAEKACLVKIHDAFNAENYAETHRLSFSRIMNQLLEKLVNIELVVKRDEMIRRGQIALNCGSGDFYVAADGRLFFPDQKFEDGSAYGYFGKNMSTTREINGLKDTVTPELFRTEAYDVDGYKFRLPNGKYTLKLYMKTAWRDNFKEGNVFTIYAQGKPLHSNLDLFKECKGDYLQPVVLETKDVEVSNGELILKFETPKEVPSDRRLCNGIEITPEK